MPASGLTVNVRDHGARGDGQTDDTAAIQAALDAAQGTGGRVWIPAGTYMINGTASACGRWGHERCGLLMRSGVTVQMSSRAVLKAMPTDAQRYSIFHFWDVQDAHILGGTLVGERYGHRLPASGPLGEWGMGVDMHGAHNTAIENVTAREFWGDGFIVGRGGRGSQNIKLCGVVADKVRTKKPTRTPRTTASCTPTPWSATSRTTWPHPALARVQVLAAQVGPVPQALRAALRPLGLRLGPRRARPWWPPRAAPSRKTWAAGKAPSPATPPASRPTTRCTMGRPWRRRMRAATFTVIVICLLGRVAVAVPKPRKPLWTNCPKWAY